MDIIGNNERGYLIEKNQGDLANCYNMILKVDCHIKVQEAEKFFENNYSIEILVNNVDGLYKKIKDVG